MVLCLGSRFNSNSPWGSDKDNTNPTNIRQHPLVKKGLNISAGKHTLTLVDELGNSITRNFSIIGRE